MADKKEQTKALQTIQKNISDNVMRRVNELEQSGGLNFPENYSYANAIKSAWLTLQNLKDKNSNLVLRYCTQESVANALLDMVVQGLSPAKNQCYFVPYGNQLTLMRSYMGTVAVTKRMEGITNIYAHVIYEADEFEFRVNTETGLKELIKHETGFKNIDMEKIVGAYAIIFREDTPPFLEVMTMEQIKKAWSQGSAYSSGKSKAHNNFTDEMAKKTVLNRACKMFFNTSDDSDLLIEAVNRTTSNEYIPETPYEEEIETEIEENANKKLIDVASEPEETAAEPAGMSEEEKAAIEAKEAEEIEMEFGK